MISSYESNVISKVDIIAFEMEKFHDCLIDRGFTESAATTLLVAYYHGGSSK